MKKILYSLFVSCLLQSVATAQETVTLGGASSSVSRTFVIEDNMRIRDLEDKTSDATYQYVLVADVDGNVDKVRRDAFDGTAENNEQKLYYLDSSPRGNVVTIDDFEFYFRPSSTAGKHLDVMLRLANDPGANIFIFYSLYRKFNMYNATWSPTPLPNGTAPTDVANNNGGNGAYSNGVHRNYYKANHKLYYPGSTPSLTGDFTPKNWADGQLLCPGFDVGDIAEVWLSYPGKPVAYRAVFYARQNDITPSYGMTKSYTILVEKFENTTP